jgi:hypothetical protein
MTINFFDHYWIIGGDTTNGVYSSATNTTVPVDDAAYVAWAAINTASPIASEAELAGVIKSYGILPAWLFLAADTFIQPTPTTYTPEQLKAYTADARWRKEQGGLTLVSGIPIKTDDRSQAKINGARGVAESNASLTTQWHAADDAFYDLTAAQVITMSDELQAHINNCFAISADMRDQITAGTVTTLAQIDAAFA